MTTNDKLRQNDIKNNLPELIARYLVAEDTSQLTEGVDKDYWLQRVKEYRSKIANSLAEINEPYWESSIEVCAEN